jgi:hypothetical protein
LSAGITLFGSERVSALPGEPVYSASKVSYRNDAPFDEVDLAIELGAPVLGLGVFAHPWRVPGPYIRNRERSRGAGGWAGAPEECLRVMEAFLGWSRVGDHVGMVGVGGTEVLSRAAVDAMWADEPNAQPGEDIPAEPNASYLRGWYSVEPSRWAEEIFAQGSSDGEGASLMRNKTGWCVVIATTSATSIDGLREDFVDAMFG